jgi:hypothetical protein
MGKAGTGGEGSGTKSKATATGKATKGEGKKATTGKKRKIEEVSDAEEDLVVRKAARVA